MGLVVVAELMVMWRWGKASCGLDPGNATSHWLLSNIYVAPGKV
jgi:hypothetical protein